MKKFTCINDNETKVDGAIEGTKTEVLEWMKKTFPGIRERWEDEMMSAFEFFYAGEIKAYKTVGGSNVYLAEVVKEKGQETMIKETKKTSKITVASKSQTNDEVLWVWKLTWEDINELETRVTLYRSEDGAKAAMEKDIRELASCGAFVGVEPKRKDALHVSFAGRFEWAIEKVKVH